MKITKEFIHKHKTLNGSWTFSQIALLGESWPPKSGWINRAIGREISNEAAALFIEYGRNKPSKRQRKKIKLQARAIEAAERAMRYTKRMARNTKVTTDSFLESYEWRRVRMIVLKRDGARCRCCGATPADGVRVHVDHIKPRKLFPNLALDLNNLQVLCEVCNHGKGNWDQTDWREPASNDESMENQHIRSIAQGD